MKWHGDQKVKRIEFHVDAGKEVERFISKTKRTLSRNRGYCSRDECRLLQPTLEWVLVVLLYYTE